MSFGEADAASGKRALIIVQNLPVPFDSRVWAECRSLTEAGYAVSVICPKAPGDPAFERLEGVALYKYPPPPVPTGTLGFLYEFVYSWLRTALLTFTVWRREGFDVIQACNPPDTYFVLAAPFKLIGKRFVFDQHDLSPEVYQSRFEQQSALALAGLHLLERGTYLVADHVFSVNDSTRRIALSRGRNTPASVTVVRGGPDDEKMRRQASQPGLKQGKPFLCAYLGLMGPQDGVDIALYVVDHLVRELGRRDCHFAFMGDGECFSDLQALVRRLESGDYVTFTGMADFAMMSAYLSTADIGLQPDPKNPISDIASMKKTMEYMAFSLPVVAFDLTETRASAQGAAVYAPSGDIPGFARHIVDLLDDPERRAAMGRIGRQRVEQELAWRHQARTYVEAYDRLLSVDR